MKKIFIGLELQCRVNDFNPKIGDMKGKSHNLGILSKVNHLDLHGIVQNSDTRDTPQKPNWREKKAFPRLPDSPLGVG